VTFLINAAFETLSFFSILVFVMGKAGVHGGRLSKKAYSMAKYSRDFEF
jgi:uncharacterized membrane protein